jgi:transposase
MTSRIEVIGRISGRRHWTVEQKLAMPRDAFGSDGRVRAAMERHEVSSGQLYTWRREAMSGALRSSVPVVRPAFAEVLVAEAAPIAEQPPALSVPTSSLPSPPVAPSPCESGRICIELPSGIKLRIDAGVDTDALARVLAILPR